MVNWDQPQYVIEELEAGNPHAPVVLQRQRGEYRRAITIPTRYALVVDSNAFQITPMQIDTWNREAMNITGKSTAHFVAGPMPRASQAPADAMYSGLLECPMTTRIRKVIDGTYTAQADGGKCAQPILTFQECFHAAATLIGAGGDHFFDNRTASDSTQPAGCSVTVDAKKPLAVQVLFNELGDASTGCGRGAQLVAAEVESLVRVSVALNATADRAELTLEGPAAAWFGAGFGAHAMADEPWTLVVDGTGVVTERKLANHAAASSSPGHGHLQHAIPSPGCVP